MVDKSTIVEPIPSATIILIRENKGRVEVLLSHRPAGMSFAAGAYVFPGGKVEMDDQSPVSGKTSLSVDQIGLRRAGVRELKEETGIDLMDDDIDEVDVLEGLIPFAHWITPEMMPKRFDTHFYLAQAPDDQDHFESNDEALSNDWHDPKDVLAESDAGNVYLMFPTILNLELFVGLKSVDAALEMGRNRPEVCVLPKPFKKGDDIWVSIPESANYSVTEVPRTDLKRELNDHKKREIESRFKKKG